MASERDFEEFYQAHRSGIENVCQKQGLPMQDWDDIVSLTMAKLWRRWDKLQEEAKTKDNPHYWLRACVNSDAWFAVLRYRGYADKQHYNSPKHMGIRNTDFVEDFTGIEGTDQSAEDQFWEEYDADHRYDALWQVVDQLGSDRQREALYLRYYHGLGVQGVADKLGIKYKQAERAIAEGKRTLRSRFRDA